MQSKYTSKLGRLRLINKNKFFGKYGKGNVKKKAIILSMIIKRWIILLGI